MAWPLQVETNEDDIPKLVRLYTKAYEDILGEMESATDFGVANRKAILGNIRTILTELGVDTSQWVDDNLTAQYQSGMVNAVDQLTEIGAGVKIGPQFTQINRQAVKALIDDTSKSFGDAMSTVNRSAKQIFDKAVQEEIKQKIALGQVNAATRKTITNDIKQTIKEQGIAALKDKSGKTWTLDRYADMLARTKIVEARNTGLANKMLENGYDLVQVSSHNSDHPECAVWEGVICSLTGKTDGYPTLDEAEGEGLFHPNCMHAVNAVEPDLAKETNAYNFDTGEYDAPFADNQPANPGD